MMSSRSQAFRSVASLGLGVITCLAAATAVAAPTVSRLTPPSELFSSGRAAPVIARFLLRTGQSHLAAGHGYFSGDRHGQDRIAQFGGHLLGSFQVTGQVPGDSAVHTATDIPLSAYGPGAWAFTGVMDNTDVFFRLAQASLRGIVVPAGLSYLPARAKRKP